MKTTRFYFILLLATLGLSACTSPNNQAAEPPIQSDSASNPVPEVEAAKPGLPAEYFGIYEGDQKSYTMKNQFGDDMIVGGKKLKIPACNYKVIFKEKNGIELQQTSLEDQTRYYYSGDYDITSEKDDVYELDCKVSDGKNSNPSYKMILHKKDFTIHVVRPNEPEFDLLKQGVEPKNNNEVAFEGTLGTESMYSGEWSVEIKITDGKLKGQSITAWMSTCGLGMEDKYAIEMTGDFPLDGSDENAGSRVKGILVKSKGLFADVSGSGGPTTREVWRIKELNAR